MNITFKSKKLEKTCNNYERSQKAHGQIRAKRLRQRLDDLRAATCLDDLRNLPGNCHELRDNLAGTLSLDLDHPYRLLFVPAHDPIPRKADGGLDWKQITNVEIIGVEDTHG